MILREDNQDIRKLVEHINAKIVELRTPTLKEEHKKYIAIFEELRNNEIFPWMEKYNLMNRSMNKDKEEAFKNDLLEFLFLLNNLLKDKRG